MKAEGDRRWQTFARTLRQALIEHDLIGLRGIGRLAHADKTEGFAAWVESELNQKVFAQGLWLKPYVRKAAAIAQARAQQQTGGRVDPGRIAAMEGLAVSELQGIVAAGQQQIVRAATQAMLGNATPTKMANTLAGVIRTMRTRTRAMAEYTIAKTHATSTLSAYRNAGVTQVGIIPEYERSRGPAIRVGDANMTQIEIANLVGEDEARKIRQWRSGTREASPEELAQWRSLGIVGATEGEAETLATVRVPLPTLVTQARRFWRQRANELAQKMGAPKALTKLAAELRKEEGRLTQQERKLGERLEKGTAEYVARRQAEGEAERARTAAIREDLYQMAAQMTGYGGERGQRRPGPGSRVSREETPSPGVIARIAKAQQRLEATLGGGLVDVVTAQDDRVCFVKSTLIRTITGDRPIQRVRRGDLVLTRSGWRRVIGTSERKFKGELIWLVPENSPALVCTPNHPIWTERAAFVRADQVICADVLQGFDNKGVHIRRIEQISLGDVTDGPVKFLKCFVAALLSFRVAVPIKAIHFDAVADGYGEIDRPASDLDLGDEGDTKAFKRLPNGRFDAGFTLETSVAPERTEAVSDPSFKIGESLTNGFAALRAWYFSVAKMLLFAAPRTVIVATRRRAFCNRELLVAPGAGLGHRVGPALFVADTRAELSSLSWVIRPLSNKGLATCLAIQAWTAAFRLACACARAVAARAANTCMAVKQSAAVIAGKFKGHVLVYNLAVDGCHEYFANGVLVHNCDECDDIAADGPYTLDEAEGKIPAHVNCRCAFTPAGKYEKDAFDPNEPRDPQGKWTTGGGSNSTSTAAFKAWFSTSKVAKNGVPLVMYHGTSAQEFGEFIKPNSGIAASWFTQSPRAASSYSRNSPDPTRLVEGARVYPVYLKIENPKIVPSGSSEHARLAALDPHTVAELKAHGFDGVIIYRRQPAGSLNERGPGDYKGDIEEAAVFAPMQVKSATGNKGTFDPNSPNIRDFDPKDA